MSRDVYQLSHDVRGVLSSVFLSTEELLGSDDVRVAKLAGRIQRAAEACVGYCSTVLDDALSCDPEAVAEEVIEQVGDLGFDISGYGIEADQGADVPIPFASLHRALFNLVKNASEAMVDQADKRLVIAVRRDDGQLHVDVRDSGPGFGQGTRHAMSMGIGLQSVYEVMAAHGGDVVMVRSGDNGTVMRLTVPLMAEAA